MARMRIEADKAIRHFDKVAKRIEGKIDGDPLRQAVARALYAVQTESQTRYLSGPRPGRLGRISSTLASSLLVSTKRMGKRVKGTLGTNLVYARIHEYGGTIKPKKGKFLRFKNKRGDFVFVKEVTMPARPFLAPAMKAKSKTVQKIVNSALKEIYG